MPRAFLFLIALAFLGFGLWFLLRPEQLAAMAGWEPLGPDARTEIRAFYGGLELGLGAFLLACVLRRERVDVGLWLVAWTLGGAGLARLGSLLLEGRQGWLMPAFVTAELLAAAAALALVGRSGAKQP